MTTRLRVTIAIKSAEHKPIWTRIDSYTLVSEGVTVVSVDYIFPQIVGIAAYIRNCR